MFSFYRWFLNKSSRVFSINRVLILAVLITFFFRDAQTSISNTERFDLGGKKCSIQRRLSRQLSYIFGRAAIRALIGYWSNAFHYRVAKRDVFFLWRRAAFPWRRETQTWKIIIESIGEGFPSTFRVRWSISWINKSPHFLASTNRRMVFNSTYGALGFISHRFMRDIFFTRIDFVRTLIVHMHLWVRHLENCF